MKLETTFADPNGFLEHHNRNVSYADCLKFINLKGITLLDYQKKMLKAIFDGKEFRSPRGSGRTFVVKLYADYIQSVFDRNDYTVKPEVYIAWDEFKSSETCNNYIARTTEEYAGDKDDKFAKWIRIESCMEDNPTVIRNTPPRNQE